jgi:ABC-type molybdate transport system substrate-binding protein
MCHASDKFILVEPLARLYRQEGGAAEIGVGGNPAPLRHDLNRFQFVRRQPKAEADSSGSLPQDIQQWFVFVGGIATNARDPEAARAFVKFLASSENASVLKSKGWEPVPQ